MTDPKQDVRQQFEAWAKRQPQNYDLSRREFDASTYESSMTRWAWDAYQAALQSPAVRELVRVLKLARVFLLGDRWRDGTELEQKEWQRQLDDLEAALSAQPAPERQGEGCTPLPSHACPDGDWIKCPRCITHPAAPVGVPDGWRELCLGLIRVVEGYQPQTWRNGAGARLKDTPEWCAFCVAATEPPAAPSAPQGTQRGEGSARELYNASVGDAHNLHCRAWSELSAREKQEWSHKAAPTHPERK